MPRLILLLLTLTLTLSSIGQAQNKPRPPFSWVNPIPENRAKSLPETVRHATFTSPSMGVEVGYCIYLPPGYDDPARAKERFPVVFHLHGGRPGSEAKSVALSHYVDDAIRKGRIIPTIYVFPNGGPLSWYNVADKSNALGEDIFVKELIPHIDETYRTWSEAWGRGIEGFSQGGRGTTRIMLKYPELFASAAPGGSGYEPEKRIQDNEGWESEHLRILPLGNNAWDLAKKFAARKDRPALPVLLWVGTKGFNYEFNLKYSAYLKELEVPHEMLVTEGAKHSAREIYEADGLKLMKFHETHFLAGLEEAKATGGCEFCRSNTEATSDRGASESS